MIFKHCKMGATDGTWYYIISQLFYTNTATTTMTATHKVFDYIFAKGLRKGKRFCYEFIIVRDATRKWKGQGKGGSGCHH